MDEAIYIHLPGHKKNIHKTKFTVCCKQILKSSRRQLNFQTFYFHLFYCLLEVFTSIIPLCGITGFKVCITDYVYFYNVMLIFWHFHLHSFQQNKEIVQCLGYTNMFQHFYGSYTEHWSLHLIFPSIYLDIFFL